MNNKKQKNKKKSLFYGFASILLIIFGLAGFMPSNPNGFSFWNLIFLGLGIYGLITYIVNNKTK